MAEPRLSRRARLSWSALLGLGLAVAVAWTAWAYYLGGESGLGPAQPIAFSHRLHVTDKGIDCFFCHPYPERAPHAGIPPLQTCFFCHRTVIATHPEIRKLREYYERDEPIPWVRVFEVPDHVYFSHRMHLRQGLRCTDCHGDVARMDRVSELAAMETRGLEFGAPAPGSADRASRYDGSETFEMGFCLECHDRLGGPRDCVACHR
jgi:hypothetical protein